MLGIPQETEPVGFIYALRGLYIQGFLDRDVPGVYFCDSNHGSN